MSDNGSGGVNRRQILKALAAAAVCPLFAGCEFADISNGEFVSESSFSLSDSGYDALDEVGAMVCHNHGSHPVLLVRVSEDDIAAFDRTCPHENLDMGGCSQAEEPNFVEWDDDEESIVCRHHFSRFSADGSFIDSDVHNDDVPDIRTFPVEFDPDSGEGTVLAP